MTAVGLDVGGTWLKLAVVSDEGEVLHAGRRALPAAGVVDFVSRTAVEAVERHPGASVGVGLAGLVDHSTGTLVWGPHIEGRSVPYRDLLTELLGVPVAVDNDANCAVFAEAMLGGGRGRDPVLLVALGTGIGVGLSSQGRVYRGRAFAGEAGHMQMTLDGNVCDCGRRGCWETLVSGTVLDRAAADHAARFPDGAVATAGEGQPSAEHLARAAMAGDGDALDAFGTAGRWLGRGVAALTLMVDPEIVVVGGAASEAGDLLLDPAREWLANELPGAAHRPAVPIVSARFGSFAGAVGAALAGRAVHNGVNDW